MPPMPCSVWAIDASSRMMPTKAAAVQAIATASSGHDDGRSAEHDHTEQRSAGSRPRQMAKKRGERLAGQHLPARQRRRRAGGRACRARARRRTSCRTPSRSRRPPTASPAGTSRRSRCAGRCAARCRSACVIRSGAQALAPAAPRCRRAPACAAPGVPEERVELPEEGLESRGGLRGALLQVLERLLHVLPARRSGWRTSSASARRPAASAGPRACRARPAGSGSVYELHLGRRAVEHARRCLAEAGAQDDGGGPLALAHRFERLGSRRPRRLERVARHQTDRRTPSRLGRARPRRRRRSAAAASAGCCRRTARRTARPRMSGQMKVKNSEARWRVNVRRSLMAMASIG